jgi:uncharacterized membrane protein
MIDLFPQRVELIHPMLVHFPVALLLTGALARALLLVLERRAGTTSLRWIYLWSWTLGSLGCVAAYLSGEEAESVVNKLICDPTITHDHADLALWVTWLAWGTLLLSGLRIFLATRRGRVQQSPVVPSPIWFKAAAPVVFGAELLGVAATVAVLVWTAHLGGTLVYEQGAGYLRTPNQVCDEELTSPEPQSGAQGDSATDHGDGDADADDSE